MKVINKIKNNIEILIITIVSFIIFFMNIGKIANGSAWYSGNWYYTSTVKSMCENWNNFFYAAFDIGGFQTVDKPPFAFWIQSLFCRIFGFTDWKTIVPQGIGSVLIVIITFFLVKKLFDKSTACFCAVALLLVPIFIATGRSNTPDLILVLLLVLAVYFSVLAVQKDKTKYLILASVFVGIGFITKMSQAFFIIPAIYIYYFIARKINMKKRLLHLVISFLVIIVISFSWITLIDSISIDNRPYIGSTDSNSMRELAFKHNGLSRLVSTDVLTYLGLNEDSKQTALIEKNKQTDGSSNTGLKVKPVGIYGQYDWFLVMAILGGFFLIITPVSKIKLSKEEKHFLIMCEVWLISGYLVLLASKGTIHSYYYIMLVPPLAILTGVTVGKFIMNMNKNRITYFAFLLLLITNILYQKRFILNKFVELNDYSNYILYTFIFGVFMLIVINLINYKSTLLNGALICIVIGCQLIMPIYWTITPVIYGVGQKPFAGPELKMPNYDTDTKVPYDMSRGKLIDFLSANYNGEKYIFGSQNIALSSLLTLDTGMPVISFGGYTGTDDNLSVAELKEMVRNNEIRYFLLVSDSDQCRFSNEVCEWIKEYGIEIPSIYWYSRIDEMEISNLLTEWNKRKKAGLEFKDKFINQENKNEDLIYDPINFIDYKYIESNTVIHLYDLINFDESIATFESLKSQG